MPPLNMMNPMSDGMDDGVNLLSILINIAFGFIAGLMIFIGPEVVIAYGTKLAGDLLKLSGYGQQMAAFGFATTAAPYIVIAPIAGMVIRQLSSVRTLKSFAYFAIAVIVGCLAAYFSQGYFSGVVT